MAEEKENKVYSKAATEFAVKNHLPFFLNTQVFLNSIFFTKSNVRSKFLLPSLTSCFISGEFFMLSIPFFADC